MVEVPFVLAFCLQLTCASSASLSHTYKTFFNTTSNATSGAPITTSPSLSVLNEGSNDRSCLYRPLEFKTGYWSSRDIPIVTIGTIYYIVNETSNSTSTTTEYSSQVVVTDRSASFGDISASVQTVHGSDLAADTLANILIPTTTKSASIKLVDGRWTTLTYPNSILDVTDSFYWRGTATYQNSGSPVTVSNIGPSSAPGYIEWELYGNVWLPPSPLPSHGTWPSDNGTVDPSDPFGFKHVFVKHDDCNYGEDFLMGYFSDEPITAIVESCTLPQWWCITAVESWVAPANYLLETTVIRTGSSPDSPHVLQATVEGTATSEQTVHTPVGDSTPKTRPNVKNTNSPPKQTASPGSPPPHVTPKETKPPKQTDNKPTPQPSSEKTHNRSPPPGNTNGGPKATKTDIEHENGNPGQEPTGYTNPDRPENTPQPTIRIGTETVTRNSDSEYVISGQTLAPDSTVTLNHGSFVTTVAMSTQGQATYLIVGDETSRIRGTAQPTSPEVLVGNKILTTEGSVVVSGDTYSLAPDGSTIFKNGHEMSVTLNEETSVVTLPNGVVLKETGAAGASYGASVTSFRDGDQDRATTYAVTIPELLLGSTTLSAGSSVVISGTTYSLGARGSTLYIDGKPTKVPWADGTSNFTLPNGVVATETKATTTATSTLGYPQSSTASVPPGSNDGRAVSVTWSVTLFAIASIVLYNL